MSDSIDAKPTSPVIPVQLSAGDMFQFRCRKGIACFNKCCESIDVLLTPYDIVRLKRRLGLSSREFLDRHTRNTELDGHGMPGLKLATKAGRAACVYLTPEGCSVYADRPTACRYYALGLLAMRRKDSPIDEDSYFVVKEDHCLGHAEPVVQTVAQYRREQGVDEYDEVNREWRQIVLKKRSSGPTVGRPSARSLELFFLASYDVDGFRAFVASAGFQQTFDLPAALLRSVMTDDVAMLRFGFRFLKQILFGEQSIALRADAIERRRMRRVHGSDPSEVKAARLADDQDKLYDSLD